MQLRNLLKQIGFKQLEHSVNAFKYNNYLFIIEYNTYCTLYINDDKEVSLEFSSLDENDMYLYLKTKFIIEMRSKKIKYLLNE